MEVVLIGGLVRALQALASATPTILIGLFIAAILRYYVGQAGTQKLFGGESIRSLPQSWLLGMLLPVCSIGVLPILREMKRSGVRAGAITAFAISAPLFKSAVAAIRINALATSGHHRLRFRLAASRHCARPDLGSSQ